MKTSLKTAVWGICWLTISASFAEADQSSDAKVSWFGLQFGDTSDDLLLVVREMVGEHRKMTLQQVPSKVKRETLFRLTPAPDADSMEFRFENGRLRSMSHHYGMARLKEWGGSTGHIEALDDLFGGKRETDGRKRWQWQRGDESATLHLRDDGSLWVEFRAERMPEAIRPLAGGPPVEGNRFRVLGKPDSRTGFERMDNVVWLDDAFNDGDSFHVLAGGKRFIVRLYHVDCAETDDRYPDRIEEQRAAFDLPSAAATLAWGKQGADFTGRLLKGKSLTVFTSWRNAGGQSKEARYFGYVMLPDGTLLGEHLVSAGLARPYGSARNLPDGTSSSVWRRHLEGAFKRGLEARAK